MRKAPLPAGGRDVLKRILLQKPCYVIPASWQRTNNITAAERHSLRNLAVPTKLRAQGLFHVDACGGTPARLEFCRVGTRERHQEREAGLLFRHRRHRDVLVVEVWTGLRAAFAEQSGLRPAAISRKRRRMGHVSPKWFVYVSISEPK